MSEHKKSSDGEGSLVDTVDAELDRLISKRASQDRRPDPDEEHDLWRASERAYFARRDEDRRLECLAYHEGQAARLNDALGALVAHYQAEAEKCRNQLTKKGAA